MLGDVYVPQLSEPRRLEFFKMVLISLCCYSDTPSGTSSVFFGASSCSKCDPGGPRDGF